MENGKMVVRDIIEIGVVVRTSDMGTLAFIRQVDQECDSLVTKDGGSASRFVSDVEMIQDRNGWIECAVIKIGVMRMVEVMGREE